ncbi:hypothetical protein PGB90_003513 [Kerria lacca]
MTESAQKNNVTASVPLKVKLVPAHPPTATMVNNAIKNLKEHGGSSLQAIKKYIKNTYKIDAEKLAPFVKKYLKSAIDNGTVIRTKGKGVSGSFKLVAIKKDGTKKTSAKKLKIDLKKITKAKKNNTNEATSLKKPSNKSLKTKTKKPKPTTFKKSPNKIKKKSKATIVKKFKLPKTGKFIPKKIMEKATSKK